MNTTRTTETAGTGILGGHRHHADQPMGAPAAMGPGTGAGGMTGGPTTASRGPVQAIGDALTGRNAAGVGGAGGTGVPASGVGGGRHTAGYGTGTTAPAQAQAGYGAGGAGMGTGRKPNTVKRVIGEAEVVAGELTGNPSLAAKGEERKTGMPATSQATSGFGTTNATYGPGANGGY